MKSHYGTHFTTLVRLGWLDLLRLALVRRLKIAGQLETARHPGSAKLTTIVTLGGRPLSSSSSVEMES